MEIYENDIQLWQRLKDKDPLAFEFIYARYRKWLAITAYGILQDEAAAQDLVQNFFIALWQMDLSKSADLTGPIKNFLFVSIRNRCLNQIKSDDRRKRRFAKVQLPAGYDPPNNILENKELRKQLSTAMSQLPSVRAKVFQLGYLHQLTRQEIASQLNISEATVKNHMALALKDLRSLLKNKVY
jgi:RNA polymerase sigma-70 factor (ECF subfamily)